ncbi:TrbC/VirB2 family protein [Wolbachia endosymbiont of Drosophila baimaii]|nr:MULTISPECIES: TrbC/VirB2 family protein [Wolbachia]MDE5058509.1 TrbC/VirB2 family protein [Wolbachia endosymbiont of Drosophila baimaii]
MQPPYHHLSLSYHIRTFMERAIIGYTHGIGGPMITIVIIGAALLAIFGRMPWPALFALGAFTAVFFGAPVVVSKITPGGVICKDGSVADK